MKRTALKRKTELKRTAPPERASALQRSDAPLRKAPLRSRPPRQADGALVEAFFDVVLTIPSRDGQSRVRAACLMCERPAQDPHHVIPKQMLKAIARRLRMTEIQEDELVWNTNDGIPLCRICHDMHERAGKRVDRWRLPACALAFAGYVDSLTGTQEAMAYIERVYP